ncbi:MAG: thioredoxin-disulfide reductase [Candidatus Komeilibacteria bacterium CG11_big_fil_rev_8_21_14_0_20_36_20]|uniref:Thioredoxin reductase n=1 Tax=Candidatus Komeilibacteria bacterium CG11_big_fil_rev_8_21_14_0_20_36_20 TaxID=1974477 RepID=A0A2H0NCI3_9BACT|nr:MAG: thioredoxin-disulfide reductase [Candidatus Komeilibacteria bacterium CG11_big_fil_rev_8_21_14_0_20_36_20]PIR81907.1 MAG: thioredoxin-disulfide reductase [Candidatus Komeilibacteria bacterium CG10_big_fil_rev_8_21_14_0_10_36_65]PJC55366.1 MAG: thioredoxin-disulfide reductase [Candidatus Komeilibacteria bacterium CG_4_9_14_0_2_um_filter_36_13]
MKNDIYDVVIIGAGPAGLTAAIYTARRALKTLVISKDVGGQMSLTDDIENYPGFETIGGLELGQKFQQQAQKAGAEFIFEEIVKLEKQDKTFFLKTVSNKEIKSKTVILAFGLMPRDLKVPGEKELTGKGVTYCATCDGPLYRDKTVIVVGGGNAALDAAEFLSRIAQKVYLLHRRDQFRGEQVLVDQVKAAKNVEIIYNADTKEIKGQNKVEALAYITNDGQEGEVKVDGVFIEIGHVAKTDWLKELVELSERQEIKISKDCETNLPGIFAAGDISDITYKQAVISAGEGAKAALQAYRYLQGDKVLIPDWQKKK